jgi:hypothetical protein
MSSNTATVVVASVATMAELFKEYLAKMPDDFDTKKEIDEYIKVGLKEIVEARKAEEKAKKAEEKALEKAKKEKDVKEAKEAKEAKVAPKKRGGKEKEKELDEDGNEIEKVKKPLSAYLIFMNSHQKKVKDAITGLKQNQLFSEVAKIWKIYKEFKEECGEEDEEKLAELWNIRFEELMEQRKAEVEEKETDEEKEEEVEEKEEVVEEKKTEKKKKEKKEEIEEEEKPEKKKKEKKKKGGKKDEDEESS